MEGKKYRLMILLFSLSTIAFAQSSNEDKIYEAFISGEMSGWKATLDQMENKNSSTVSYLTELINYQYGYIGWCLGNENKKEAKKYLDLMEENLETLKKYEEATVIYNAYMAASFGFKIGLSSWRAAFLGPKSVNYAENALEIDDMNFQANVEMGNIWYHMPAMFGGSIEKALSYYNKAIEIYENSEDKLSYNKWLYLNTIATSGKLEFENKKYEQALQLYKKALNIEPRFKWVINELLPELKEELQ